MNTGRSSTMNTHSLYSPPWQLKSYVYQKKYIYLNIIIIIIIAHRDAMYYSRRILN